MVDAIPLFTIGFRREIPADLQAEIIKKTYAKISPETDFIVFRNEAVKTTMKMKEERMYTICHNYQRKYMSRWTITAHRKF